MSASVEWWRTFFERNALELWRRAHSPEQNRAEASDLQHALRVSAGARVLDVPCGDGRLSLELAARGLFVTGLDASGAALEVATERSRERGLEVTLFRGDMRSLTWHAEFDAAFCMGNSFGYFDRVGDLAFLRAVANALRPGGCFVIEYPLLEELLPRAGHLRDWFDFGEQLLLIEGELDPNARRLDADYHVLRWSSGHVQRETKHASYHVYDRGELGVLLAEAGFMAIEHLANLGGTEFRPTDTRYYVRAVRHA